MEKSNNNNKRLKREIDAIEEENSSLKSQRRKLQRDYEEVNEAKEVMEREVATLRAKVR